MTRSLVMLIAAALMASSSGLGQNPASSRMLIGTWKQNMEKSVYNPGPSPQKGSTSVRQYAAGEDGSIVAITMNVDPEGIPSLGAISAANYDGREYEQHTVATLATSLSSHVGPHITRTISYEPIDQYSVTIVQRQDGKVVARSVRTISRDGKTMTDRYDYMNDEGRRVTNVLIFEKQ
jgi:hypothetical protein